MKKQQGFSGGWLSYSIGFIGSLITTLLAYFTITAGWLEGGMAVAAIMLLAVVQLVIQLVFFLHLGREDNPRWNQTAFLFMAIMVAIIVVGSIWIMNNLNYNMMMTPEEMNQYMLEEGKKGF